MMGHGNDNVNKTLKNGPAISVRNLALWTRVMGHDPCKKILFNVVFLVVVAKRRRCSMLCVRCVQCVGVVFVRCCVVLCVRCCVFGCVCVAHTLKITVYIYI